MLTIFFNLFDHPERIGLASDRDKGLQKVLDLKSKSIEFVNVACHAHLKRNVRAAMGKSNAVLGVTLFEKLSLSPTVKEFEAAKAEATEKLPALMDYLQNIPAEKYALSQFSPKRWGITSNPVESFWAHLKDQKIRSLDNVVSIYRQASDHLNEKIDEVSTAFSQWSDPITAYATREIKISAEAQGFKSWKILNLQQFRGVVQIENGTRYECDAENLSCTCTAAVDRVVACAHLLKIFEQLGVTGSPGVLVAPVLHTNNWRSSFNSSQPLSVLNFNFQEENAGNSFQPPIYSKPQGRPKDEPKKRSKEQLSHSTKGCFSRLFGVPSQAINEIIDLTEAVEAVEKVSPSALSFSPRKSAQNQNGKKNRVKSVDSSSDTPASTTAPTTATPSNFTDATESSSDTTLVQDRQRARKRPERPREASVEPRATRQRAAKNSGNPKSSSSIQ